MNAFVTGATGLVGSHLVASLLESGVQPVCLVRDHVPSSLYETLGLRARCVTVDGDLSDSNRLERILVEHEIDTVFHLAAQTIVRYGHQGPLSTFEANIQGAWNILEACRRKGGMSRVVVASSDKAYGPQDPPYVESMPLCGTFPYDVSKSCTDLIANSYHKSYGLPVVTVRCSNLYGPGDLNWSRIIPRTLRFSMLGDVELRLRGRGLMKRDYMYVTDAVSAYRIAATHPAAIGKAYNFGTGDPITITSLVDIILRSIQHTGPNPVTMNDDEFEIAHQWMDCSLAKRELGWELETSLEAGLKLTADWYRDYFAVAKCA